jgi:hypothetical protein
MASKYRIIKLKSGETLICTLGEVRKKTIILERPMNFASHVVTDGAQLMGTEMLLMKNWIEFSTQSTVEIPLDHIAAVIRPDENIISCYDIEKRKEDDPILREEYRNAVRELAKIIPPPTNTKKSIKSKNEINKLPEVLNIGFTVPKELIPDVLDALGVQLPEEVEDRIQKQLDEQEKKAKKIIKKKPLPPKPNKDTLGNDWTDWSADPNDLI